jgi:hypothetical protein
VGGAVGGGVLGGVRSGGGLLGGGEGGGVRSSAKSGPVMRAPRPWAVGGSTGARLVPHLAQNRWSTRSAGVPQLGQSIALTGPVVSIAKPSRCVSNYRFVVTSDHCY